MLARHRAAHGDAGFHDVGTEQLGAVQLVRVVRIEQDQRVQVAVTRVKHVAAAEAILVLHLANRQQDVGQALARDGAVHAHVVRADAPAGRKGILAPAPEAQALGLVLADGNGGGTSRAQHLAHAADFLFHLLRRAIAFAQQDGGGIQVVASMDKVLHGGSHGLVHHFQPGRDDACGDHVGHGFAGLSHIGKAGHDAARQLRLGNQLDGDVHHHRQHAFAADGQAEQVIARSI